MRCSSNARTAYNRPLVQRRATPRGRCPVLLTDRVAAEKTRALAERCRPRDLYDVVHMHRHPDLIGRASASTRGPRCKCAHAGIECTRRRRDPHLALRRRRSSRSGRTCSATSSRAAAAVREFWKHSTTSSPGSRPRPRAGSARAELVGNSIPTGAPPHAITSWRPGYPWS